VIRVTDAISIDDSEIEERFVRRNVSLLGRRSSGP